MKALIKDYVFNPVNSTITLPNEVELESLLVITNVTQNKIIYNFADSYMGAEVGGNVITLQADTMGMLNTDSLQIFIDVPNTDFEQLAQNINDGLVEIVHQLKGQRLLMPDSAGRTRVNMETGGTLAAVTTVGTVANQTSLGGFQANNMAMTLTNVGAQNLRNKIGVS